MRLTSVIVVFHVIEGCEHGFCDEGVALGACVFIGGSGFEGKDVRLAVLLGISLCGINEAMERYWGGGTLAALCVSVV